MKNLYFAVTKPKPLFRKLILTFVLLLTAHTYAQYISLSEDAEISIITIGPGVNLYDTFGHSAFLVQDPNKDISAVYNYGVYDVDTPNFYTKFAQGKLNYRLEGVVATPFIDYYIAQNRWVKQQTLNLSYAEKQTIFTFLNNNLKPENQYYLYDFFYDNCATKIRDVLVTALGDDLEFTTDFSSEDKTFRQLIQQNAHWNTWGSLGMDVAIGAVTDKKANSWQYQFLPEYVYLAAEGAAIKRNSGDEPLVDGTATIFETPERDKSVAFFTSPLFVFTLLALLIIGITYRDHKRHKRSRVLDVILFLTTGVIGIFLCLLWFATDHSATANNYNIVWGFPFNLLLAFFIGKKQPKRWVRKYIVFLVLLLVLLVLHWCTGIQEFAYAFIPLFIALAIRYGYLVRVLKNNNA